MIIDLSNVDTEQYPLGKVCPVARANKCHSMLSLLDSEIVTMEMAEKMCRDCRTKVVAVAGGFDPLHLGHIEHMQMARKLGSYLVVLVSNTDDMKRKKGYEFMPMEQRVRILDELRCVDFVVPTVDEDGTQAKTLGKIKVDIYAKGGDRTADNMPEGEVEACRKSGITLVYGVGKRLESSSELVHKAMKFVGMYSKLWWMGLNKAERAEISRIYKLRAKSGGI